MSDTEPVHVTKAHTITETNTGQTQGMTRHSAIVNLYPTQQLVGTLMRAAPHSESAIHHHGDQDTIVYAVSGHGAIMSEGGRRRDELGPGDWAVIPRGREHQEVNGGEEEVVWVIVRAPGGTPEVVNLTGWGGEEVKQ